MINGDAEGPLFIIVVGRMQGNSRAPKLKGRTTIQEEGHICPFFIYAGRRLCNL